MRLDQPLSDSEFDELDDFLLSDRTAEDCMAMDTLHGFLTALAIGPQETPITHWLPHIWSEDPEQQPQFKSDKEATHFTNLIARFMNEILITFEVAPKEYEPLFLETEVDGKTLIDAQGWAGGFWAAIQLQQDLWQPIFESNLAELMDQFRLMGSEEEDLSANDFLLVDTPQKVDKLSIALEAAIPHIYQYWKPKRQSATRPIERETPKVGRNDECPCGSGKKYKQCCGKNS